jgi:hypothetical protein
MHGIFKPFQVNFHVLPFKKKTSKYFSFCDTVFSSWGLVVGFAIFHIVISLKRKKGKKKKKKKHSSMVCESWWAPEGFG